LTRDFLLDAAERAIKTFAQTMIAFFGADVFDVLQADWGNALPVAAGSVVLSLLTSLLSLKLGNSGTASATDAVVPEAQYQALHRGLGDAGLGPGPR
jgi:hypothetical protein